MEKSGKKKSERSLPKRAVRIVAPPGAPDDVRRMARSLNRIADLFDVSPHPDYYRRVGTKGPAAK